MVDDEALDEQSQEIATLEKRQLVEAALYLAGRPLQQDELAKITEIDSSEINGLISDLQEKYRQFFSCFEIVELPGQKFVLQVKSQIASQVKEVTLQPLLSIGELRTLSMIAYQQPILQSKVAKVRGQQAYGHIKALIRKGFIKAERYKQTYELRTTPLFSDYFGLSQDQGVLKRQLGWRMKRRLKRKKQKSDSHSIDDFMSLIGLDKEKNEEENDSEENEKETAINIEEEEEEE
jgi:segregation and condensation protein B